MLSLKDQLVVDATPRFIPEAPVAPASVVTLLQPSTARPANDPSIDHRVGPTAVWAPASSARIRTVESAVIGLVMVYFGYGVGAAVGLF